MKKSYLLIALILLLIGVVSSAGVWRIPSGTAEAHMMLPVAGGGTPAEESCAGGADGTIGISAEGGDAISGLASGDVIVLAGEGGAGFAPNEDGEFTNLHAYVRFIVDGSCNGGIWDSSGDWVADASVVAVSVNPTELTLTMDSAVCLDSAETYYPGIVCEDADNGWGFYLGSSTPGQETYVGATSVSVQNDLSGVTITIGTAASEYRGPCIYGDSNGSHSF